MIEPQPLAKPPALLPESWAEDVIILPREVVDGRGLYDDSVVSAAKELRADGVPARYAHGSDARDWIGEQGIDPIVLNLIIGIASNAGWAGISLLIRRRSRKRVRVRVARIHETSAGRRSEWFELDGPGTEVAEALEALQPRDQQSVEEPSGAKKT